MEEKKEAEKLENSGEEKLEWYYRFWVIALAILAFGPLGLLPLWFRPRTKLYIKVLISVLVFAVTIWMMVGVSQFYRLMMLHYKELAEATGGG
jgi:hypothetical protein